jgi:formamidopyrimidine-DNA glycosylase
MPEHPDIVVYLEALETRILGQTLEAVRIVSPFLLRTANPPLASASGKKVIQLRRLGKRICVGLEDELWLVLHLMIAGRLHWRPVSTHAARPKISPPPTALFSGPKPDPKSALLSTSSQAKPA